MNALRLLGIAFFTEINREKEEEEEEERNSSDKNISFRTKKKWKIKKSFCLRGLHHTVGP